MSVTHAVSWLWIRKHARQGAVRRMLDVSLGEVSYRELDAAKSQGSYCGPEDRLGSGKHSRRPHDQRRGWEVARRRSGLPLGWLGQQWAWLTPRTFRPGTSLGRVGVCPFLSHGPQADRSLAVRRVGGNACLGGSLHQVTRSRTGSCIASLGYPSSRCRRVSTS